MIRRTSSLAMGVAVFLAASGALAQQNANALAGGGVGSSFGMAGTLVLGADRMFGFTHTSFKVEETQPPPIGTVTSTTSVNTFSLLGRTPFGVGQFTSPYSTPRIGIDYFVIDNLSLGGSLTYIGASGEEETEAQGTSQTNDIDSSSGFLISPRVGFGMMFSEFFGIWPRGGITYFTASTDNRNGAGQVTSEVTLTGFALTVEVPLILSPADHVGITIGPSLDFPLSGTLESDPTGAAPAQETDFKITDIGVNAGLIAWF